MIYLITRPVVWTTKVIVGTVKRPTAIVRSRRNTPSARGRQGTEEGRQARLSRRAGGTKRHRTGAQSALFYGDFGGTLAAGGGWPELPTQGGELRGVTAACGAAGKGTGAAAASAPPMDPPPPPRRAAAVRAGPRSRAPRPRRHVRSPRADSTSRRTSSTARRARTSRRSAGGRSTSSSPRTAIQPLVPRTGRRPERD